MIIFALRTKTMLRSDSPPIISYLVDIFDPYRLPHATYSTLSFTIEILMISSSGYKIIETLVPIYHANISLLQLDEAQ